MKQLNAVLDHLKARIFEPVGDAIALSWCQAQSEDREAVLSGALGDWAEVTPETIWGEPQAYFWFRGQVTVPAELEGARLYLWIEAQFGRVMGRSDPQCLVRINGEIRQGADFNHREVLLTPSAKAGEVFEILIEAGTIEDRRQIGFGCSLLSHDPRAEKLYYDLRVPLDVAERLPEADQRRYRIVNRVREALSLVDLRPGNDARFAASLETAGAVADEIYQTLDPETNPKVVVQGHTHIDVAWMWRVRETRQKMARSMATALTLMEEYPDYQFMYNQGYLLDTLQQDYPVLFDKMHAFQKEGRFEIEGALWLEPDANMTGGESLVRHILKGIRYHQDTFDVTPKMVWLPDTFGYSAALPQIMAQSGLESFITHKMSWNDTNKIPSETFWWEGLDGTRVPTYLLTTQPMESTSIGTTYCPDFKATHAMGSWRRLSRKDLTNEVFAVYGHGDGGGGPTREMLEHLRRMERGIPGCPIVEHGTMGGFLDRLTERMHAEPERFPSWVGELYLEFHRGTFTSVAEVKRNNRRAEATMRELEALAVLAMLRCGAEYPTDELAALWDIVLLNQFHDILPGSSIGLVYEDSRAEFETFFAKAEALTCALSGHLGGGVFNATGAPAGGLVASETGQEITLASGETALVSLASPVPAMGGGALTPAEPFEVKVGPHWLENAHIRVELDGNGLVSKLLHKASGQEVLAAPGNKLTAYRDLPAQYDAWDIDLSYRDQGWDLGKPASVQVVDQGPHRGAIRIEWRYESSTIVQVLSLTPDSAWLEVDCWIDWQEKHTLLKAAFPIAGRVTETVAEMQFGHVRRATHANTSWDAAKFEYPMHRWVAAGDNAPGLALLNDSKYGYDFDQGDLRLTLLRSPAWPWEEADIGEHRFRYGMMPFASLDEVAVQAEAFNHPLLRLEGEETGALKPLLDGLDPAISVEAIKKAEGDDAIILRLYERFGRPCETGMRLSPEVTSVEETSLLEEVGPAVALSGKSLPLSFRPFEIKSFRLNWSR